MKIITIILGFFKLSTKLVPIKPQKNTINIFPIIIAKINFLNFILDHEDLQKSERVIFK